LVVGSNVNARMNWVREMAASVESDANHSVRVREEARSGLEVLAQAFGISIARRDHPRSLSYDDFLQGELQNLKESTDRLRKMFFDEELAERLLSESMDRLTIVARDVSDLAAETAIDLALIETKRIQIDRAQAENWAQLRELTGQAQ
jgi:hypothetical protein